MMYDVFVFVQTVRLNCFIKDDTYELHHHTQYGWFASSETARLNCFIVLFDVALCMTLSWLQSDWVCWCSPCSDACFLSSSLLLVSGIVRRVILSCLVFAIVQYLLASLLFSPSVSHIAWILIELFGVCYCLMPASYSVLWSVWYDPA